MAIGMSPGNRVGKGSSAEFRWTLNRHWHPEKGHRFAFRENLP